MNSGVRSPKLLQKMKKSSHSSSSSSSSPDNQDFNHEQSSKTTRQVFEGVLYYRVDIRRCVIGNSRGYQELGRNGQRWEFGREREEKKVSKDDGMIPLSLYPTSPNLLTRFLHSVFSFVGRETLHFERLPSLLPKTTKSSYRTSFNQSPSPPKRTSSPSFRSWTLEQRNR